MLARGVWPFYPDSLSDVFDSDTLSVLATGCSDRIQRPLTILAFDKVKANFTHRIEMIDEKKRYGPFCAYFRQDVQRDALCEKKDEEQARQSLDEFRDNGDPFRCFLCHMGLQEMTHIIQVHRRPVALLFSGQYAPPNGKGSIHKAIEQLGGEEHGEAPLSAIDRHELGQRAKNLQKCDEEQKANLVKEAHFIQNLAETEFKRAKWEKEHEFLDQIQLVSDAPLSHTRAELTARLEGLLQKTCQFIQCAYAAVFTSIQEGDTFLALLAQSGIPAHILEKHPHFNWRKANLPLKDFNLSQMNLFSWLPEAKSKGIRNDQFSFFSDSCIIFPFTLGDRYRSVLVLGPLKTEVQLEDEMRFLKDVADTICRVALGGAEVIYLEGERKRWHNTARLLTHQFKTALTPVTTNIGRARLALENPPARLDVHKVDGFLKQAEDLAIFLSASAKETLEGRVLLIDADDLNCEPYPLSVLVGNCASGFQDLAKREHREIVIDSSIEMLPEASIDAARMTVAIANLIENAVKYSFENTLIKIQAHIDFHQRADDLVAIIDVEDYGREIREDDRIRIFEIGTRGSNVLSIPRIRGSGLGLWEARSIVEAHGGEIRLETSYSNITRREGKAQRKVFSVHIPISQEKKERRQK